VHFQTPGSVEAYYQEAGRAGRDGEPARCVLFFGAADLMTQRRLSSGATSAFLSRRREHALAAIERYATQLRCRQQVLIAHFTGSDAHPVCGRCDVCLGAVNGTDSRAVAGPRRAAPAALPADARDTVVRAVGRLSRPVGKSNLARRLQRARVGEVAKTKA